MIGWLETDESVCFSYEYLPSPAPFPLFPLPGFFFLEKKEEDKLPTANILMLLMDYLNPITAQLPIAPIVSVQNNKTKQIYYLNQTKTKIEKLKKKQ